MLYEEAIELFSKQISLAPKDKAKTYKEYVFSNL